MRQLGEITCNQVIKQHVVNWQTACNAVFNFLSVQCVNICLAFSLSKSRNKKSKAYHTFTSRLDEIVFLAGFSRPGGSKLLGIKKRSELIFNSWQQKEREPSSHVLLQHSLSNHGKPQSSGSAHRLCSNNIFDSGSLWLPKEWMRKSFRQKATHVYYTVSIIYSFIFPSNDSNSDHSKHF